MDQRDVEVTIEALRGIAQHVVLISSMDVYRAYGRFIGKDDVAIDNTPVTEAAPLRGKRYPYRTDTTPPDSAFYNYDKIVVEDAFLECPEFQTTVLRLPAVYGPADKQHRTYDYVKRMVDGRPAIFLDQDMSQWRWSRGFVDDVAWGIFLAATKNPPSRVYNIAEPSAQSEYEWLLAIARTMNWNGKSCLQTIRQKRIRVETVHRVGHGQDPIGARISRTHRRRRSAAPDSHLGIRTDQIRRVRAAAGLRRRRCVAEIK